MSMTPLFHVTLPDLDDNSEESHFAPLLFILEGMILLNMWHIQRSLKKAMRGLGRPVPPCSSRACATRKTTPAARIGATST